MVTTISYEKAKNELSVNRNFNVNLNKEINFY